MKSTGTCFDTGMSAEATASIDDQALAGLEAAFAKFVVKKELTEAERLGQQVGAIGGVLKKNSLTFLDPKRFKNVAIKLTQLRVPL